MRITARRWPAQRRACSRINQSSRHLMLVAKPRNRKWRLILRTCCPPLRRRCAPPTRARFLFFFCLFHSVILPTKCQFLHDYRGSRGGSLVRSRRAPPVPLIVLPKSCSCRCGPCPPPPSLVWVVCFLSFFLFEVDILWPRWVANNIPEDRTLGQGPIALRGGRGLPRPGALPTTIRARRLIMRLVY